MQSFDIYCEKILTKELDVEIVRETEHVLAFKHTRPFWETHIVVIPKQHIDSFTKVTLADKPILEELMAVSAEICADVESTHGGCRLSTNVGTYQSSKHLHFYIHAGQRLRNEDGSPVGGDH